MKCRQTARAETQAQRIARAEIRVNFRGIVFVGGGGGRELIIKLSKGNIGKKGFGAVPKQA